MKEKFLSCKKNEDIASMNISRRTCFLILAISQISSRYPNPASGVSGGRTISRARIGNIIQSYFDSCIPHVVRYPTDVPLKYQLVQAPMTQFYYDIANENLTELQTWLPLHLSNSAFNQGRYHINAIRNFRCFLVLVSTSAYYAASRVDLFYGVPLKQDQVLSFRCMRSYCRVMPYYFVGFIYNHDGDGQPDFGTTLKHIWPRLSFKLASPEHPTPSFFFTLYNTGELNGLGTLHCWACESSKGKWRTFSCTGNEITCAQIMWDAYRSSLGNSKRIPWLFVRKDGKSMIKTNVPEKLCPFHVNPSASCLTLDEVNSVFQFLIHDSNWTTAAEATPGGGTSNALFSNPRVTYDALRLYEYPEDVLLAVRHSSFAFVTSDSVRQMGFSFSKFLAPYEVTVWVALGASTASLAVCVPAISRQGFGCAISNNLLNFASVLCDQFTFSATQMYPGAKRRVVNVVTIFWLFMAIVITNSYKAIMKSHYVLEPTYTTYWKSLQEMTGFAFIFTYRPKSQGDLESFNDDFRRSMSSMCNVIEGADLFKQTCVQEKERSQWEIKCLWGFMEESDSAACLFFDELQMTERQLQKSKFGYKLEKFLANRLQFLQTILSKVRIRPTEMLGKVVADELSVAGTAF